MQNTRSSCCCATTEADGGGTFQARPATLHGDTMPDTRMDDPDLSLVVLFCRWPAAASVFLSHRMLCFGCSIAPFHTLIDACNEYGLDEALFRAEVRRAVTG